MKLQNFLKAMEIISNTINAKVIINHVSSGDVVGKRTEGEPTIHITDCTASAVNGLQDAGFSLSMVDGMLSVSDIFIHN